MKSEPQWSVVRTSTSRGSGGFGSSILNGRFAAYRRAMRPAGSIRGAMLAAPATAAPFRNFGGFAENFRRFAHGYCDLRLVAVRLLADCMTVYWHVKPQEIRAAKLR